MANEQTSLLMVRMRHSTQSNNGKSRGGCLMLMTVALIFYVEKVASVPADVSNQWPTFPRRNIATLARDGYLKTTHSGLKRSISTLAKNGQLPTFRSPYDETDKQEQDDESHEKRNVAYIARMRSYPEMKRNVQALARDGYRPGRGQTDQQNEKRNIQALARDGLLHKKDDIVNSDEYFYPFYQNPIPPLSEIDGPFDYNELYDLQQSVNPDMFPPLSQVYKRAVIEPLYDNYRNEMEDNWSFKRGAMGLPVHGLYRPFYAEPTARTKRYILSLPDVIDKNDIDEQGNNDIDEDKRSVDKASEVRDNFEKRHIGSLARLGLLPSFRFSGGRYSRSGRARLLLHSQEMYRKHSPDENFGIRQYFVGPQAEPAGDTDNADVPPPSVSSYSHPTGRILHRPLNNDLPDEASPRVPSPPLPAPSYIDALAKNRWQSNTKEIPRFFYFRSLKVPYHTSGKRYLLIPAVDNILLRKTYPNSSLPSRQKNQ